MATEKIDMTDLLDKFLTTYKQPHGSVLLHSMRYQLSIRLKVH